MVLGMAIRIARKENFFRVARSRAWLLPRLICALPSVPGDTILWVMGGVVIVLKLQSGHFTTVFLGPPAKSKFDAVYGACGLFGLVSRPLSAYTESA